MQILANMSVIGVTALQLFFLLFEIFLWDKPAGCRIHGLGHDAANKTRILAANQGLYNGFLAAGLIWSLFAEQYAFNLQLFFLSCVIVAGVFGGITANRLIIWIQALPGAIALLLVFLAQSTI